MASANPILQTVEQILTRYKSGDRNFEGIELPEQSSLHGADLSQANFSNSWLSDVDFSEANLQGTLFENCNVKVSDFRDADLRGSSFRNSALCGANFFGARVDNAVTDGATWYGAAVNTLSGLACMKRHPNLSPGFASLVRNSTLQGEPFRSAFDLLENAIASRAFPGCALAVTLNGELIAHKALGHFTYDSASAPVTTDSIFDLASVSKVVATTSMAMILYERGLVDLDAPITAIVPEFGGDDARRHQATLRMLLAHSCGLPAYEKLFLSTKTRDELLAAAFITELAADPGARAEYSDIGFIILGVVLERLADEPLDTFCQREIFGPLGMTHTTFNPAPTLKDSIPPTVDDLTFRLRLIQGEVQDENASVLGGVAGHAGLFSTAEDVAVFAHTMLNGGRPILRRETVELFTRRESSPAGTSRALGWDTPSSPSQSGRHFSSHSFGHLGYTGTSLWIDPDRQLSITLLTNRTWPDCKNQAIKQVRPAFHDAVVEALEKDALERKA